MTKKKTGLSTMTVKAPSAKPSAFASQAAQEEVARLNVNLPKSTIRKLKGYCLENDINMSEWVRSQIDQLPG